MILRIHKTMFSFRFFVMFAQVKHTDGEFFSREVYSSRVKKNLGEEFLKGKGKQENLKI